MIEVSFREYLQYLEKQGTYSTKQPKVYCENVFQGKTYQDLPHSSSDK